ncbi:MAG TPA: plastocyanin/azurin family copper-binding protein [Solirubrobacterales bacterium]|nr:plastocyanin/azurin family copper-binding protein [Solirubrobacterales bacterium]
MEETAFYAIGIALVVIALIVSVSGLRSERFPTTRLALAGGVGLLVALVAATTTSAVILAREEQRHRNEEAAHEEQETATEAEQEGESPKQPEDPEADGGAPAETGALDLEADAGGELAFDTDALEAGAGEVTITLDNPASIEHDVAIERDGEEIAKSDLVSEGTTEVTAELEPGEYVFYCSVPGHREGGMEGTLTVK